MISKEPVLVFHLDCAPTSECLFSVCASFSASLWALLTLSALPQPFPFWDQANSYKCDCLVGQASSPAALLVRPGSSLGCLCSRGRGRAAFFTRGHRLTGSLYWPVWYRSGRTSTTKGKVGGLAAWSQRLDWLRTLTAFRATSDGRSGIPQDAPTKPPNPSAFEGEKQFYYTIKCLLFVCFWVLFVCFITSFQVVFSFFMCMVVLPVYLRCIMYVL